MTEHRVSSDTEMEEDGPTVNEPTFESLLEENKQLKAKVNELRKPLALKDRKIKVKALLKEETGELEATMKDLVLTLGKLHKEMWGKEQEIMELKKKLLELKEENLAPTCQPDIPKDTQKVEINKSTDAIALLPEEMWRMILLGHLTDTNDLLSCCSTCKLFKRILHQWDSGLLRQSLPHFYMNLSGNELLGLRTICKSWKVGVDRFLRNHPSLIPNDGAKVSNPRRLDFVNPMKEKGLGNFIFSFHGPDDNFEDPDLDFQNMDRWNPFIGRSANLSIGRDADAEAPYLNEDDRWWKSFQWDENADEGEIELWDTVHNFLDSCGRKIWHLTIGIEYNPHDNRKLVQRKVVRFFTTDMIQFLPNLRTLSFSSIEYNKEDVIINPNALPEALHLESLDVRCISSEEPFLLALLQRYHGQLRKLHLQADAWKKVSNMNWSNLAELYVTWNTSEIDSVFPRGLPNLRILGIKQIWRKANFGLFHISHGKANVLLNAIQELCEGSPRLNTMRYMGGLSVPGMVFHSDDGVYGPAQIKTFEIDCSRDYTIEMKFIIRYFPFLENLNLFSRKVWQGMEFGNLISLCSKPEYQEEERRRASLVMRPGIEIIHLRDHLCDGSMYKSNIWELLPNLKVFTFQWDVYTRGEYESFKDRKNALGKN